MERYFIFSLKMAAWWGKGSVYTSDIERARDFTRDEAIEFCKTRYDSVAGSLTAIPISEADIAAVRAK